MYYIYYIIWSHIISYHIISYYIISYYIILYYQPCAMSSSKLAPFQWGKCQVFKHQVLLVLNRWKHLPLDHQSAQFFEGQNDSERAFWATPHCSRQLLKLCTHLIRWNNKMDKMSQRPDIFHGAFQISTSSLSYSPFKSVMPMNVGSTCLMCSHVVSGDWSFKAHLSKGIGRISWRENYIEITLKLLHLHIFLCLLLGWHCHPIVIVANGTARDCWSTINKARAEKHVRMIEHPFLERDHNKLGMRKMGPNHMADVLGMAQIQGRIDLIQDIPGLLRIAAYNGVFSFKSPWLWAQMTGSNGSV